MFDAIILDGTRETEFLLLTRNRSKIGNTPAAPQVDASEWERWKRVNRNGIQFEIRKEACGVYNCAGLVWANRRTAIYESAEYELILREDGYRKIVGEEKVQLGDIVVCRLSNDTKIVHVGVIILFKDEPAEFGKKPASTVP